MSEVTINPLLFVGRALELQQLQEAFSSALKNGRPKFMFISGEFGIGKTALIEHFLANAARQHPKVVVARAKCAMETEGNGLVPFSQLLNGLMPGSSLQSGGAAETLQVLQEVAPAWLDILPSALTSSAANDKRATTDVKTAQRSGGVDIAAAQVHIAGDVVGRDKIDVNITNIYHKAYTPDQVFVQFANALRRLTEQQDLIVFIDDLQWADESSLRLLFHLARNLETGPMLWLGAYRPVEALETGASARVFREIRAELIRYGAKEVELGEGISVVEYVKQRYPRNSFSRALLEKVQVQTEGHALFVSQIFSLWEETGVIEQGAEEPAVWRLSPDAVVPALLPRLGEVLDARISQMEDELKGVLTSASIEGDDFTLQVVTQLRKLDDLKAYEDLERLEHRYRLVHENGVQRAALVILDMYRFVHRFFRERIYQTMSSGRRRTLHRQVGECLEALYLDRRPIAGQLARHFDAAQEPLKTAQYALLAAQVEQSRYAWAEGEQWCTLGLERIQELPLNQESLTLHMKLLETSGHGCGRAGRFPEAYQRYSTALALFREHSGDPIQAAGLCAEMVDVCDNVGRSLAEAESFLELGRQILNSASVPFGEVYINLDAEQGFLLARSSKNGEAIACLEAAIAAAENLAKTPTLLRILSQVYNTLSFTYSGFDFKSSAQASYKAIDLAHQLDDKSGEAVCWLNLAAALIYQDNLTEGAACNVKGAELAKQTGNLDLTAYAKHNSGMAFLAQDRAAAALPEIHEAIAIAEKAGSSWDTPSMYADLATACLMLEDIESAAQYARTGLDLARNHNTSQFQLAYALHVLARIEAAREHYPEATEHFQKAIQLFQDDDDRILTARARRHFAELLIKQDQQQPARELLELAEGTFLELNFARDLAETRRLLEPKRP